MITEDYVSFETAKLLKEKKFDWECISYYVDDEPDDVKYSLCGETNSIWESRCCSAPTLQMTMRWLRKVHNLHIWVDYSSFDFNDKLPYLWNIRQTKIEGDYWGGTYHKSYEEACEEAIKYCLENLI